MSSSDDMEEIARSTGLHRGVENGSRWHSGAAFKSDSNKTARSCGAAQLQALKAIASNAPGCAARFCKKRISMPALRDKLTQSFEEIMSMPGVFRSPGLAGSAGGVAA
ncbi:MAG: hypothetical protein LBU32_31940 [Clostridiales bacterium]|nr:hypothetical protein [Clostridiales bacterium]